MYGGCSRYLGPGQGGATIRISVYPRPYSMQAPILNPKPKNPRVRASQEMRQFLSMLLNCLN